MIQTFVDFTTRFCNPDLRQYKDLLSKLITFDLYSKKKFCDKGRGECHFRFRIDVFFQENAHEEFINIIDGLQKENPALVDVAIKHYISQVNSSKLVKVGSGSGSK